MNAILVGAELDLRESLNSADLAKVKVKKKTKTLLHSKNLQFDVRLYCQRLTFDYL